MTEAERKAALDDIKEFLSSRDESSWEDVFNIFCEHIETIRAALLAPAVQEVTVEELRKIFVERPLETSVKNIHHAVTILQENFPSGLRIVRGEGEK